MLGNRTWLNVLLGALILVTMPGVGVPREMEIAVKARASLQTSESDWPMLQHDVRHSGYTPVALVSPDYDGTLNIKWKVGLGERIEIEMQPIVAYDRVYIGVMNGKLHAVDEETGEIEWTYQAGGAISHTPAAGEGKVFFGTEDHKIYALSAETGEEVWTYETGGPVLSSPIVHDQTVYIGSFDHHLYALNTETGHVRWHYDAEDRVWTSPSLDSENNRLYFGSEQPKAHCLDATTGQLIWDSNLNGEGMRNTYPTFADNVVIFQTIKPGISAYIAMEDFPDYIDDATTLSQYADYYSQYPERRHLYYLDAATGADMWDGAGTHYVPVVVPYWGMLEPVIDPQGYAWMPINSGGDTRNIDLYKVDLSNGNYTKVAEKEDFFERGDETGHFTFANGIYFSTVLSTISKYDPSSNQRTRIFGPFPFSPFECVNLDPMPVACAYVDRIAGTTGFGGINRASALVIANRTGFFTTHGWLYAVTPDNITDTKTVDLETDFTAEPPTRGSNYHDLASELNKRVEHIISYGHLEPFPYFWDWSELPPSLWHEGEMVRALAHTMPYLTRANRNKLKQYLRDAVVNQLLDPSQYEYKQQCQLYGSYEVVHRDPGEYENDIKSCWLANNENYIAERVYAIYAYAQYTGDWQLVEDNWDFIVSRYNVVSDLFDSNLGHAVTKQWLSGQNLDLQTQAACLYAMKEMAYHVGDNDIADQAENYYNQVIQTRIYYGNNLIPELYDSGILTPTRPEDIENQKIVYPPDGIINRETDIRQLGWRDSERMELRVSGTSPAMIELTSNISEAIVGNYDYPVQHLQMYPEIGKALSPGLQQATQKYIDAIAFYNPWWYWGDNGHVSHKGGENLYSKPFMAAALFQAKAYILKEDFDTLKNYLPWPVNRAGFRDIYRLQNLVALLQAEGAYPEPSKSATPRLADVGQPVSYTVSIVSSGHPLTITDILPRSLSYISTTATVDPNIGQLEADSKSIRWSGTPSTHTQVTLSYIAEVVTTARRAVINTAIIEGLGTTSIPLTTTVVVNNLKLYLPIVLRDGE